MQIINDHRVREKCFHFTLYFYFEFYGFEIMKFGILADNIAIMLLGIFVEVGKGSIMLALVSNLISSEEKILSHKKCF